MQNIIIVESPSKSKTISSYLGNSYTVLSSKGHICDLATSGKDGLGIDVENGFVPNYKINKDKEALVKSLKKACKGNKVYLATDPDREGEAIAYHLARELDLDLDDLNRIEFHEITKTAVNEALLNPHKIDLKMVDSQECRRMIDRILGFKLSKLLQKKIGSKSAGRVQSVALLLIVNLEKQIRAFVPIKYYEAEAIFPTFKATLHELNGKTIDSKNRITDRAVLENLKSRLLSFVVSNIVTKQTKRNSYPTFTTSTMQQEASSKLGFSPSRTMRIAQSLYEGKSLSDETVGLITYMRTDSTRLADSFVAQCRGYIEQNYGSKYQGFVKSKTQKNAQDAHEGIRPTSIYRTPDSIKAYLTDDEYKLYNLIYKRTLASLMSSAVFNSMTVEFTNTDSVWTSHASQLVFDGYLKVYGRNDDDLDSSLPKFNLGDAFNPLEVNILDKETEPKSRYTEASIIKEMEELGIGRPSTYAQTIQTLKEREYIKLEKKSLVPTEQGELTTDKLVEFFNKIINVEYTANMENDLDKIETGTLDKQSELTAFYTGFMPIFDNAMKNMESKYPILIEDEYCPVCGNNLTLRLGRYGEFIACSNYPECAYVKKNESQSVDLNIMCTCGNGHIVSRVSSRGKSKGNVFYACSNYPKCKKVYNQEPVNQVCDVCGNLMVKDSNGNIYCENKHQEESNDPEVLCPKCNKGHLVKRVASRGKSKGNEFYGCNNYPRCKTIISIEEYNKLLNNK